MLTMYIGLCITKEADSVAIMMCMVRMDTLFVAVGIRSLFVYSPSLVQFLVNLSGTVTIRETTVSSRLVEESPGGQGLVYL